MSGKFVHDLVSERAKATPDASAVVAGDQKITYHELDARSNQVAHLVLSRGAGPEAPVALCMSRSIELAVAALGVLKAGRAYLPLDPSYPPGRIALILEDAGASLVMTQPSSRPAVPSGRWTTVTLEPHGLDSAHYSRVVPARSTNPDDVAYIVFTSGSSGRPKGVQVTHANLMNLVSWHQRAFNVTRADKATLHASPGFDASVWELWPYLTAGASVHVVPEEIRSTPEVLRDWLVANGITVSFFPTALAECVIGLSWPQETSLRFLLTGADTLRRRPPKDLPFVLVNNYGPTECTVVASSGTVQPEQENAERPSIGKAIDGVAVYIVDEWLRPVPLGEPGEILIGGAGVARGYLNAPDLTAEKFVSDPSILDPSVFDPSDSSSSKRLYRTGDIARYLPDGEIEFLGRMDDQLKINGYRIEPQEISTVLERCPGVAQSAVSSYRDHLGNQRLVAYLVADNATRTKPSEIRAFLTDYLPEYMVPSTFVALPALPMSAHGKVNRAALPEPTPDNILDDDAFEAPESAIEQQLASFLSDLISVGRIGRDDNFFALGGHSLMAAQLIAKIRQTFGVDLSLRKLFEAPTVREMSAQVEKLIYAKIAAMGEEEAQRLLAS